jgi:hypothetical protein
MSIEQESDESSLNDGPPAKAVAKGTRQTSRRGRPRLRKRWIVLITLLVLLTPVLYSYTTTMLKPSSLPLSVRSVEWLRAHHGNWIVDEAEHIWYSWHAPKKGGPQLQSLPAVGQSPAGAARARAHTTPWPPPIPPVFPQALPGEGVWQGSGPLVNGSAPVLLTTFRSELNYPRLIAYVAWFDQARTSLAFYPGRYEPPKAPIRGPMSVPQSQRSRLLATFNGGFTYADGHNGSSINGLSYEPLRDGLATLVGYRDGRLDVQTWHGGKNAGPDIAFARQSLPLIVDNGQLSPKLNDSTQWGYTLGNRVRVWRTGVGIDRRGNVMYAAANNQTVTTLARILKRAGAVRAMQFDINPEWPSLITYKHQGGLDPKKVVPNVQQRATRYLTPDDRDFFAVYRRVPGPVSVPFS